MMISQEFEVELIKLKRLRKLPVNLMDLEIEGMHK